MVSIKLAVCQPTGRRALQQRFERAMPGITHHDQDFAD